MCASNNSSHTVAYLPSQMIDTLSRKPSRRPRSLDVSSPPEIHAVRLLNHPDYGNRIVLVDTPAFGYTDVSEIGILQMLSDWLRKMQANLSLS